MAATHPESTDTGPHDTNRPDTEAGRESVFSLPLASLSPGDPLRWLARGKALRGGVFDIFGRTEERRMERELIERFEARVRELLPQLTTGNLRLAVDIAAVPLSMRGFGHVKQAAVVLARVREMELLHRFDAARYPAPPRQPQAGQIKGIPIAKAASSVAIDSK